MNAPHYAVRDEVLLAAPPARVWSVLMAELSGASQWWLPNNTFIPLASSPARPGSSVRVEVRPNGRDARGPVLAFIATTRECEPERRLLMDFVDGCFRGSWCFELVPSADGSSTRLMLAFDAEPRGWVRQLARVVDVGAAHSTGVRIAFERLAMVLDRGAEASNGTPVAPAALPRRAADRIHGHVIAPDGSRLATVEHLPLDAPTGTAILLHGWASDASSWDGVADILTRKGVRVLCLDLRGHGGSARALLPETTALLEVLVKDVLTLLEDHDVFPSDVVSRPVIVGHSGSGLVAIDVVSARSSSLAGLVLVSSAAKQEPLGAAEDAVIGSSLLGRVVETARGGELLLSRTMGPARPFSGRRDVASAFAATAPSVRRAFFRASSGSDRRAALSSLALAGMPIAVVSGDDDRTMPVAAVQATARTAGLMGATVLAGRGHALPVESPGPVAAEILQVIRAGSREPALLP